MQYLVAINQSKALEWGLNAQQAMLFAFLHQVPTWATARQIDGQTFFNISKTKIVAELPLLTDKPDTAYRLMKQLAKVGLLVMTSCDNKTYMRLTEKALAWNRLEGSENFPTPEKSPSRVGKISEPGSEKSPTNQVTNDPTPSLSGAGDCEPPAQPNPVQAQSVFERAAGMTDQGRPAPRTDRQQPMTLDWEPEPETWQRACWERGLAPDADERQALLDFREHFAAQPGRTATQADWTRRFARWVHENQQRQAAKAATGGDHANRRDRTPARRLTAAEARERDRIARAGGGQPGDVIPGEYRRAR